MKTILTFLFLLPFIINGQPSSLKAYKEYCKQNPEISIAIKGMVSSNATTRFDKLTLDEFLIILQRESGEHLIKVRAMQPTIEGYEKWLKDSTLCKEKPNCLSDTVRCVKQSHVIKQPIDSTYIHYGARGRVTFYPDKSGMYLE